MKTLFAPTHLGKMQLSNHIVMAPMTRSRAISNVPNDLMAEYYSLRADAGLIITEGTSPSPNGLGYARIPGLFNSEQVAGWTKVTKAVHAKGGHIFVQLMHTGRTSHELNLPKGAHVLAPSAVTQSGRMYTDEKGLLPYPTPQEMTAAEIETAKNEHIKSAQLAIDAGFDGIELHGANGYLLEQFLNPKTNKRTDSYGGSSENRMRFVLEVAEGCAKKIGGDKVGIRLSPYGANGDMGAFEGIDQFYATLAKKLSDAGLVYIHIADHSSMGAPPVSVAVKQAIRANFSGAYILSGGFDAVTAEQALDQKLGDLVAFGRPFLGNPDLVEKMKKEKPIRPPDQAHLYTPGPVGYTQL